MFTTEFEIILVLAAFALGATEGANITAWVKSWFVKEVKAVEDKVVPAHLFPTTLTGQTGPTGP